MPSSFLPAIPASLPLYPKYYGSFHTQTSPSPTLAPTRKRLQHRRPDNSSYTASTDADRDSDEDVMRNSLYSDTAFRTSLAGHSRKRGLADDDGDDYRGGGKHVESADDDDGRPAKRRIIDVVGSVASRVWEFCISKTPFFAPQDDGMEFEREVQRHMGLYMPGQFSNSPQHNPSWAGVGGQDTGMGGTHYSFHAPPAYSAPSKPVVNSTAGGLSSRWVMVSPTPSPRPSTATVTAAITAPYAVPRPYTAPSPHAPYSPTTYATTATSATTATASTPRSRRNSAVSATRRPATRPIVASSSRAKRPTVVRHKHSLSSAAAFPAPPSQSAFTFGSASSSPARGSLGRRKLSIAGGRGSSVAIAGGRGSSVAIADEDEDEEDESIRRFNEKLKDMIREGREALGSRIEVTYDDDDDLEGF